MPLSTRVNQNVASFLTKATILAGSVAIGGAGAVGARVGRGFSIARTGTGLYTVTIDGVGALPIMYALASVVHATVSVAFVTGISPASRTFSVQTGTAAAPGTAADPPSGSLLQVVGVINNMPIGQN